MRAGKKGDSKQPQCRPVQGKVHGSPSITVLGYGAARTLQARFALTIEQIAALDDLRVARPSGGSCGDALRPGPDRQIVGAVASLPAQAEEAAAGASA